MMWNSYFRQECRPYKYSYNSVSKLRKVLTVNIEAAGPEPTDNVGSSDLIVDSIEITTTIGASVDRQGRHGSPCVHHPSVDA